MELVRNRFKEAILARQTVIGTWLMSGSASVAEALGSSGLDFVVVDMEHTPIDVSQTIDILRALAGTQAEAVTRLPWNDPVMVKRVLDSGAQSLMFPQIQTVDEARKAVDATQYPPRGMRGVAGVHRGSRYGAVNNYLAQAEQSLCVIVQLETPSALRELRGIAEVRGVDSLFVGPADLSAALGHLGDIGHTEVQDHLRNAAEACRALGKPCGIVGANPSMVRRYLEYGYSWVAVGADLGLMLGRVQECLREIPNQVAPATTNQRPTY